MLCSGLHSLVRCLVPPVCNDIVATLRLYPVSGKVGDGMPTFLVPDVLGACMACVIT